MMDTHFREAANEFAPIVDGQVLTTGVELPLVASVSHVDLHFHIINLITTLILILNKKH